MENVFYTSNVIFFSFASVKFDNRKILDQEKRIYGTSSSLREVAARFTCPPQFLLVLDKRIICFFLTLLSVLCVGVPEKNRQTNLVKTKRLALCTGLIY